MTQQDAGITVTLHDRAPADWGELLVTDPAADYFHTPYWAEAAGRSWPGVQAFWICARMDGRLVGGLTGFHHQDRVDKLESGLDGTSGGPLVDAGLPGDLQNQVFEKLVGVYLDQRKGGLQSICLTFNAAHESRWGELLRQGDEPWQPNENPGAIVPLEGGPDHVDKSRLAMNKRNERNRGLRRGARLEATNDAAVLAEYYPLYAQACEIWGKVPTPLPFLEDLLKDEGPVYFVAIIFEGKVIGGHLNLLYGERTIAWNGVTDREHARTIFPATLAMWGDILFGCERGAKILDLGGSGGVVSLERFKKFFGAETEQRGHYILEPGSLKLLRGGKKVLDRLRFGGNSSRRRWHDDRDGGDDRS